KERFAGPLVNASAALFSKNHSFRVNHAYKKKERYMPRLTKLQRKHNQERINRAAEIIQGYQSKVTGEDAATCLRDVLADLMHFAKSRHLSIEAEVADACKSFED